jgi:hypothetical protein
MLRDVFVNRDSSISQIAERTGVPQLMGPVIEQIGQA